MSRPHKNNDQGLESVQQTLNTLESKVESMNNAVRQDAAAQSDETTVNVGDYVPELRNAIEQLTDSLRTFSSLLDKG